VAERNKRSEKLKKKLSGKKKKNGSNFFLNYHAFNMDPSRVEKKKIINLSKTSVWGEHQLFNVYIYIYIYKSRSFQSK
jgi:hypothetical protein